MSQETILKICKSIYESGKKPTTALVKAKLKEPLPLAIIMKTVNLFNQNPDIKLTPSELDKPAPESNSTCCCEAKIFSLEIELKNLKSIIEALQTEVAHLKKQ